MASGVETSLFAVGPRREITAERNLEGTLMWVEPIIEASVLRSRVSGDTVNVQMGGVESAGSGSLLRGGMGSCGSQSGVFESSVVQNIKEQVSVLQTEIMQAAEAGPQGT